MTWSPCTATGSSLHVDDEGTPLDVGRLVGDIAADALAGDTELYMCGPIRLMDAVRRAWLAAGLPPTNLRYETFGNSGWFDPEEFVVRIPQLGIETIVGTDTTVLDALTAAGADLMYDCRKGECGLCLVDVARVDGHLDHRDVFLSTAQQEAGDGCACASPASPRRRETTDPRCWSCCCPERPVETAHRTELDAPGPDHVAVPLRCEAAPA